MRAIWLMAASREYLLSLVRGGGPEQAALPHTLQTVCHSGRRPACWAGMREW